MEKKKLLIVDDIPENLTILYRTLHDDYDIIGANSGSDALMLAQSAVPDLILLDIMMPDMNGYEVCRILKEQEKTRDIPVIFITALIEEADEIKGFGLGAADFITKPFRPAILKRRIRTHIEIRQTEKDKQAFEQQFQQAQKLESLGILAGGIAHDFNNILTIIIGHCYLMTMNPNKALDQALPIQKAAERAADLCRQMLAYAGKALIIKAEINITTLVEEMITMLKTTIQQNVVIKPDISADVPLVHGDASQLRQIVMNLIINSSESIGEEQGEVSVSLKNIAVRPGHSDRDHLGKVIPHGWYACLEVADNGCGMDDETKSRIFEPFYTTKFAGRGLGMSATLGIITAHNGSLQLASHPGQGTTIKLLLPILKTESIGEESPQQDAVVSWQGGGTILLVEDEEQIAYLAKSMLIRLGFSVIEASNGRDALELYRKNAADIKVVMTDMGMPIMDGFTLVRELKTLNPQLQVIISSGFGDAVVTSKIDREEIAGLVSKPYNIGQLRNVLISVMGKENSP